MADSTPDAWIVTPASLQAAAQTIQNAAEEAKTALTTFKGKSGETIGSAWASNAATKAGGVSDALVLAGQKLQESLAFFAELTKLSGNTYDAHEGEVAAKFPVPGGTTDTVVSA